MPLSRDAMDGTSRSPLGGLIAELRAAAPRRRQAPQGAGAGSNASAAEFHVEMCVVGDARRPGPLAVRWLLPASLCLHGIALLGLVVGPLLRADALPPPSRASRVFLVAPPASIPAPPPPATPSRPAATPVRPRVRPAAPSAAPTPAPVSGTPAREAPASVAEEVLEARAAEPDAAEPTAEAGAPGGISWGVPGGVVGGIVGGVSEAAAPAAPVRVGDGIKEPVKLKHVPPVYPDIAARANVQGAVVLDCTVSPQGRVTAVTVVRGVPLLNEAAISAVRQWIYTPTLKDGAPVPVLMTVTVRFGLS